MKNREFLAYFEKARFDEKDVYRPPLSTAEMMHIAQTILDLTGAVFNGSYYATECYEDASIAVELAIEAGLDNAHMAYSGHCGFLLF